MDLPNQPLQIIKDLPPVHPQKVQKALDEALSGFSHKIVVLDDDPTGTQTVHGIYVYTDWNEETLLQAFLEEDTLFYILTNSRSLSSEQTKVLHQEIATNLSHISQKTGIPFLLISRGDSTLRGHYPLETDTLRYALESDMGTRFHGEILCPFFEEGGRFTLDNIHYVQEGELLIPAGQSEFARDQTFAYTSSNLMDYIEEKSAGAVKATDCIPISLQELRSLDYDAVSAKLLSASDYTHMVVNATTYEDLMGFGTCLIRALKAGRHFMIRSAGSLPRVLGNIAARPLLEYADLVPESSENGGLIIIGSHVRKTTLQMEGLKKARKPLHFLEFETAVCLQKDVILEDALLEEALNQEAARILAQTETLLSSGESVVIFTSRSLVAPENSTPEERLALSVKISDSLTGIVSRLSLRPRFILAKGGITSSDVATKGLAIQKALVLGQVRKGIPVWLTGPESRFPDMPYIIFPGNVGTETTLCEIADILNP